MATVRTDSKPASDIQHLRHDSRPPFDPKRAMSKGTTSRSPSTAEIDEGYGTELFVLTDEDLEIIDRRAPDERLVVTPHLERFDDHVKNIVVATAFRGLVARNMVRPPSIEMLEAVRRAPKEAAPVDVELAPVVAALIQVRSAAPVVVCAHRTTEGRREYAYWYLLGGEATVEELVEPDGMHRFRGLETTLLDLVIYGFVNPDRVAGGVAQGPPHEGAAGSTPAEVLSQAAGAQSIAEFLVRVTGQPADHPRMVGVASDGEQLLMAETDLGSPEPVQVREVDAASLYEAIKVNVAAGIARLAV